MHLYELVEIHGEEAESLRDSRRGGDVSENSTHLYELVEIHGEEAESLRDS